MDRYLSFFLSFLIWGSGPFEIHMKKMSTLRLPNLKWHLNLSRFLNVRDADIPYAFCKALLDFSVYFKD